MKLKSWLLERRSNQRSNTNKRKTTLLVTLFLALCSSASATLVTHEWAENHRGYSIEIVPGTGQGGNPFEYVAAGTVYDQTHPYPGWHFMHLDDNGNVISERTSWASSSYKHAFRVVDIACQSANAFWITIQARNQTAGSANDYIYLAGVDLTGNDLTTNPSIAIRSNYQTHKNLYPTHSYIADDSLYICGYAADGSEFPSMPTNYYTDKYGMFLKVNLNTTATNSYFWDGGYTNGHDYDMALKIAPNRFGQEFPLLVTGAVTTPDELSSAVLVAKFESSGMPITLNSLQTVPTGQINDKIHGFYGIDIRGGIYGGNNGSAPDTNIIVLVNEFDTRFPKNRKYGIMRIKHNLAAYPSPIKSYLTMTNDGQSWAKQFGRLHSDGTNASSKQDIIIVGEQIKYYNPATVTPPGNMAPGPISVNAFTSYQQVGSGHWDFTSGWTPSTTFNQNKIYLSSMGTGALGLDYLNGKFAAYSLLEDVSRLYTFSTNGGYYEDPSASTPAHNFSMILPIGNEIIAPTNLRTKYLKLDNFRDEPDCNQQTIDAYNRGYAELYEPTLFTSILYEGINAVNGYTIFALTSQSQKPTLTNCASGYYKPTNVAPVDKNNTIKFFPNPTTDELNINFGSAKGEYSFILTDVTGKQVMNLKNTISQQATIQLPSLCSGLYIATVTTGTISHTEKITIE